HLLGDGLSPPLAMQAEMLLRQRIALLSEGLEGLAKYLHLHPRALQRELSKAGTSYSALVAHIRHDQASAMLRDTVLDIDSIALKLGFSERRSFTLAFRQWQGCTPSDYRRSIRAQADQLRLK
ncbi:MAG: helix-turn-helix transcriptional regulator, partial [Paraperlucidibaca sp.]